MNTRRGYRGPKGGAVHVRISQNNTVIDTFEKDAQNTIDLFCVDQTMDFKVETIIDGGEITSTHQFREKCPVDALVSGEMTLMLCLVGSMVVLFF